MKKYNRIIILSIIIYLGLAFLSGNALLASQNQQSHAYRVESQRIINQIQDISQVEKIDLRDYQYVKAIDYIKSNVINQNQLESNTNLTLLSKQSITRLFKIHLSTPNI